MAARKGEREFPLQRNREVKLERNEIFFRKPKEPRASFMLQVRPPGEREWKNACSCPATSDKMHERGISLIAREEHFSDDKRNEYRVMDINDPDNKMKGNRVLWIRPEKCRGRTGR